MLALVRSWILLMCLATSFEVFAQASGNKLVMQTGRRWFYGSSRFLANELRGSLLYEISGLPMSAGGAFSFYSIRKSGLDVLDHPVKVEGAWAYEVALEAKLSLPKSVLTLPITPYLIYAHDLFSDYKIEGNTVDGNTRSQGSTNGYKFNLGMDIPVNPQLSMNMEYSMGSQSIKHKYSRMSSKQVNGKSENIRREGSIEGSLWSQAFLVGLELRM